MILPKLDTKEELLDWASTLVGDLEKKLREYDDKIASLGQAVENVEFPVTTVVKSADEIQTSNTTMADDAELTFPVAANTNYRFRFTVFFVSTIDADIKVGLSGPSSPTALKYWLLGNGIITESTLVTVFGGSFGIAGSGNLKAFEISGVLFNVNAGDVALQWAQVTSDATNTTVFAGSSLDYEIFE